MWFFITMYFSLDINTYVCRQQIAHLFEKFFNFCLMNSIFSKKSFSLIYTDFSAYFAEKATKPFIGKVGYYTFRIIQFKRFHFSFFVLLLQQVATYSILLGFIPFLVILTRLYYICNVHGLQYYIPQKEHRYYELSSEVHKLRPNRACTDNWK